MARGLGATAGAAGDWPRGGSGRRDMTRWWRGVLALLLALLFVAFGVTNGMYIWEIIHFHSLYPGAFPLTTLWGVIGRVLLGAAFAAGAVIGLRRSRR